MHEHKVLCVDDDPNMLESLALTLGRSYEVATAGSGAAGLQALAEGGPFAVVISDMRMPRMDGAEFLSHVREQAPDSVRVLLTGQADLQAAIAAVNEGQVFRFLTKPCPPRHLLAAAQIAVEQYELIISERVLLEQTLRGSIKALMDVLGLANPQAFGRATRIKQHAGDLARTLGLQQVWAIEVAAMVSQIGAVTLPAETVTRLYHGEELSDAEQAQVERLPALAEQILEGIPRLDLVRAILSRHAAPPAQAAAADDDEVTAGAEILRMVLDYDTFEARGLSVDEAAEALRRRGVVYKAGLLTALTELQNTKDKVILELPLGAVKPGMVFMDDVHLENGLLLVARGHEMTRWFADRIWGFPGVSVKQVVRVMAPAA